MKTDDAYYWIQSLPWKLTETTITEITETDLMFFEARWKSYDILLIQNTSIEITMEAISPSWRKKKIKKNWPS